MAKSHIYPALFVENDVSRRSEQFSTVGYPLEKKSRNSCATHSLSTIAVAWPCRQGALDRHVIAELNQSASIRVAASEREITMKITNFKDMYIAELQEMVSMEGQLADELPRMAEVASHRSLKHVLTHYREETQIRRQRLESILQKHGANPRAHTDQAMQALVNETEMMLGMLNGNQLRDAGLIASAQKLEHYEIAAYGTVAALAGQLDLRHDQQILHESLEEKKQADVRLTKLAKGEVNPQALAA